MYKSILIISDNLKICQEVKNLIKNDPIRKESFTFSISPFSDLIEFNKILKKVIVFDLRNKKNIEEILHNYDLVISMHCKQIFPRDLVKKVKCINVHPGYNPINRGWYPQVFAILENRPIGATIT